ncbi:MAG: bidirectional hydrogenase complex protein HoxU [Planctomycetota bacterium]
MDSRQENIGSQFVTLTIDDQTVTGRAGQSVLEVARGAGIEIPTLCYLDGLSVHGGCRLCLIEIDGTARPVAACAQTALPGMVVRTQTKQLQADRRTVIEMLFAERNHICAVCVSNGHCELQAQAEKLGVNHVPWSYRYPALAVDNSHTRYRLDHNRCILCTRCVRVCDEVEGAHTIDILGRGIHSLIVHDLNTPWGESNTCTSCGKCVQVCPTGALSDKSTSVGEMQKKTDFLSYLQTMRTAHDSHRIAEA